MKSLWPLLALLLLGACEPPPRAVRIEVIPKKSCGLSTRLYDITCVKAVEIKVIDVNGSEIGSNCTTISGIYDSIDAIIGSDFLPLLEDIRARPSSKVELRAYHAFNKVACTDQIFDELMMWGSSDFVDFTDPSVQVVSVHIECRSGCDCAQQKADAVACPAAIERGVCTLPKAFPCRGACTSSDECRVPGLVCTGDQCTPNARAICADCSSASDCTGGKCIRNVDKSENYCSSPCPAFDNVDPCPGKMSCTKIDGIDFQELP